jgi:hypothetical protein
MFKTLKWEDWVGVALGAWLFASPWVLGYRDNAAVMNALIVGSLLVIVELLDLGAYKDAEELIDIVAGSWLLVSPLALGFADATLPAMNAAAVGLLTALSAIWALTPFDAITRTRDEAMK